MKPTEMLLKAKNNKHIRNAMVVDRMEYTKDKEHVRVKCLRLIIDIRLPFSNENVQETVDTPMDIMYEDYTRTADHIRVDQTNPKLDVFFYDCVFPYSRDPWCTFLRKIRKESEIGFRIRVNNNSDGEYMKGLVHHQLFGFIDEDCYFLNDYCGPQNSASPVKW